MVAPTTVPGYKLSEWHPLAHDKVRFVGEASRCASRRRGPRPKISANRSRSNSTSYRCWSTRRRRGRRNSPRARAMERQLFLTLNSRAASRQRPRARRSWSSARSRSPPGHGADGGQGDPRSLGRPQRPARRLRFDPGAACHPCRPGAVPRHRPGQVRVISPDVGGGFGYKVILQPEELCVAWLALKFRRPFRYVEDRREHLVVGANSRQHHYRLTAHADERGRLLALDAEITIDGGAYSAWPFTVRSSRGRRPATCRDPTISAAIAATPIASRPTSPASCHIAAWPEPASALPWS